MWEKIQRDFCDLQGSYAIGAIFQKIVCFGKIASMAYVMNFPKISNFRKIAPIAYDPRVIVICRKFLKILILGL